MSFFNDFNLPRIPSFNEFSIDIRNLCATESDMKKNNEAIALAIKECESHGGGSVIIPEGVWLCGPIHLKSNINLHLKKGATLKFSGNFEDYMPPVFTYRGGVSLMGPSPLVYAYGEKNIAITGEGTLDGTGVAWWGMAYDAPGMSDIRLANRERRPIDKRVYDKIEYGVRPSFVNLIRCENLLIEGVTLINSPSWTLHLMICEGATVRNIRIKNPKKAPNTDGIDIECSRRVLIEDCDIDSADDIFCIKSGRNEEAWDGALPPTEDVIIRNCRGTNGCGGATVGSETSGGVRNILFEDCSFEGARWGIRVKTARVRGGIIENVSFKNIELKNSTEIGFDVMMQAYAGSYEDSLYPSDNESPDVRIPTVRRISAENVKSIGSPLGMRLLGIENHEIEDVTMKNCEFYAKEAISVEHAISVNLENTSFRQG